MGEILDYFKKKKNLVNLLVLGILVLGIPISVNLVRLQQIIKSRAAIDPIVFIGSNVRLKSDGTWVATKPQIQLQLTSPLGLPADSSSPSASVRTVQSKDSLINSLSEALVGTVYAGHCEGDANAYNRANYLCSVGTYCVGNDVYGDNADGTHTGIATCPYGCSNGSCNSAPPTSTTAPPPPATTNDSWCTGRAGVTPCSSGDMWPKPQGSCIKDGKTCTQYYEFSCTTSTGQSYCTKPSSQCAEPCQTTTNPCTAAGYTECKVGDPDGTCTNGKQNYKTWECTDSAGKTYCGPPYTPNIQTSAPCGNLSATPGPNTYNANAISCQTSLKPSQLSLNPNICDQYYQYVLKAPISAGGGLSTCSQNNTCKTSADCPPNTDQDKFINPISSNWCYGFAPSSPGATDWGARCLQLRWIGSPTAFGVTCATADATSTTGLAPLCPLNSKANSPDLGPTCTTCIAALMGGAIHDIKYVFGNNAACTNQQVVNYMCNGGISPDNQQGCLSNKTGATCAVACGVAASTSPSGGPAPTSGGGGPAPSGSGGATSSPVPTPAAFTTKFRIAEQLADLNSAPWQDYTSLIASTPFDYTFKDTKQGQKFIFVQFIDSTGKTTSPADCPKCQAQIKLLGPDPTMKSCSLSFEGNNAILNLTGQNFGSDKKTVKSGDSDLQIRSWKDDSIQAVLQNAPTGQVLPVNFTNTDEQTGTGQCSSISQLALGAKVFCRAPAFHDTENVEMVLVDETGKKTRQTVRIDKNGVVQGLTQRLEDGKRYMLSLKAPKSLRRNVPFTAGGGTVSIPNFVLPVGEIFPLDGGDGVINALDKAELNREWNISGDATGRLGDFNQDGKINSIDWACMRFDFGQSDDPEPTVPPPPASSDNSSASASPR